MSYRKMSQQRGNRREKSYNVNGKDNQIYYLNMSVEKSTMGESELRIIFNTYLWMQSAIQDCLIPERGIGSHQFEARTTVEYPNNGLSYPQTKWTDLA